MRIEWELEGWRREVVIWGAVCLLTIFVGEAIGTAIVRNPPHSRAVVVARFDALLPGDLELAKKATPTKLDKPVGIGFEKAGIALTAASEVDSVTLPEGNRRAPEGSNLLAFSVGNWTCEDAPCQGWDTLEPLVSVDGETQALPEGGNTFVLVVPPGTETVDLTVSADGFTQTVSLLDHTHGNDTIQLLERSSFGKQVPINQTFQLGEVTSIPLDNGQGGTTTQFTRQVTVSYAQARFFLNGATPSDPGKQFLVINAYYSLPGRTGAYVFTDGEITFVDAKGHHYAPRDLDPSPSNGLLGFEVPATVRSGNLVIGGGTTDKTASNGATYTSTLAEQSVPISLDAKTK